MVDKCGIDPRLEIIYFVQWILAPVALTRAAVYLLYRQPQNYQTFLSFSFALTVYYHTTFGFWTIENVIRMIYSPPICGKAPVTILKLIYNITLVLGAFPAVVFALGLVFMGFLIPYMFFERYQRHR